MPMQIEASTDQKFHPTLAPALRIVDKHGFQPKFAYGQSIFVIEGMHVEELKMYKHDDERIYAVRWSGVRTSVPRDQVIFTSEQAATEALARKKGGATK